MKKEIILILLVILSFILFSGCEEKQKSDFEIKDDPIDCVLQKPGSDDYKLTYDFKDPLNLSIDNAGPGGSTSLVSCVEFCLKNMSCECRDWIQSIYNSFKTYKQSDIGKINGIWLPTICTVRNAVRNIPTLKRIGINSVSFGPDIETRHVEKPKTIGDNLFRFYVKLFEDAGFVVHLVPNTMHWGNNDVSLYELNEILLNWAEEAERLNVEFYAAFNEVDGMQQNISESSIWLQQILPLVKEKYQGILCVQPTQSGFESGLINYSGFDCVSSFYPLMVPDQDRVNSQIEFYKSIANEISANYNSIRYILFNDVATFSGGNWAETHLMEAQFKAESEGRTEYSTEKEQSDLFELYLNELHPFVDGSFFNNYKGFSFLGRDAEEIVENKYSQYGILEIDEKDYLWKTTGFLELIENATLDEQEKDLIFDLNNYSGDNVGWAGLCFNPTIESPGPFNCTTVESCMNYFKNNPEQYWSWVISHCEF